ncbi:MAG: hypothetical protein ACXVKQ_17460, partial [Acidimicrobiia bacterium]
MKRLAVVGAVAMVVALGPATAYSATSAATADAKPRIALLEQPAWTTLGNDVPLRLKITGPVAGLEARAIVHSSLTSRTGFERTVGGDHLGSTIATAGAQATALPLAPSGGRVLTLKLQDPNASRDTSRLRLPLPRGSSTGVFPVEIELRDPQTGERASSFVTHMVAVSPPVNGAPMGEPLNVA